MNKTLLIYAVIVFTNLAALAYVAVRQSRPAIAPAPLPNLAGYNLYTAAKIRELHRASDLRSANKWMHLSDVYIAHGFFPEAEACARQAVGIEPENADLVYRWAFCLSAMGETGRSIELFHRAVQLGYEKPQSVHFLLGRDLLRQEQYDLARKSFAKSADLPAAQYELAKLAFREGNADEAVRRLETVQAALPSAFAPHWLRSQAEAALERATEAAQYSQLSQLCHQKIPSPVDEFRIRYLEALNEYSLNSAIMRAEEQLMETGSSEALTELARVLGETFDPQMEDLLASQEIFAPSSATHPDKRLKTIIETDGASTYRCFRLAMACKAAGKQDQAIDALKMGLRLDGRESVAESRKELIELYEAKNDLPRARFHATRLFLWEAMRYLHEMKVHEAKQKLELVASLDPNFAAAWYYLGMARGLAGDKVGQREAYRKCIELEPNHGRAQCWLKQNTDRN